MTKVTTFVTVDAKQTPIIFQVFRIRHAMFPQGLLECGHSETLGCILRAHRLHKQIQVLMDRVVASRDPDELDRLIHQLQDALHEHSSRLRQLAADKLAKNSTP